MIGTAPLGRRARPTWPSSRKASLIALLVVAADDGVMPQTREHLAILDLLEIPRGVVAITKTDRVSAERVAEVSEQIRQLLQPTPLRDAALFPLSNASGVGIPELLQHLQSLFNHPAVDEKLIKLHHFRYLKIGRAHV